MADIVIDGNTGDRGELRYTPSGVAVLNVPVAENYGKRDPHTHEWVQEGTSWFRVSVWGKAAETLAEMLTRKGMRVLVVGDLRVVEFETRDGGRSRAAEVRARRFVPYPEARDIGDPHGPAVDPPAAPRGTPTPGDFAERWAARGRDEPAF